MDFSRHMSYLWERQWLVCNLGSTHTQSSSCWKGGEETLDGIGVSWFHENDPGTSEEQQGLLVWAQVHRNEALLGWCIHRLLCEIRQSHSKGSLLAWGFPHLWYRDLKAIPGHWPSDGVVGCSEGVISLIRNFILYSRKYSRQSQCVYSCQKLWFYLIDIFF